MAVNGPCRKDCPNRSITCHAECEEYKVWQQARRKELDNRQTQKEIDYTLTKMSMRWGDRRR